MLLGSRLQDNEREQKIKKSQIYKQMLDQQIMLRDELRKEKHSRYQQKDYDASNDHLVIPAVLNKQNELIEGSYVRQLQRRQQKQKSRFLPLIKDKNTFFQGSSRFLKVQQQPRPYKQHRYVKTEQIEEEYEDSEDQYNSTCQKIIKQLQSITSKPVKFRHKRRISDRNDGTFQRKFGDRSNDERQHVHWQDQQYQQMPPLNIKSTKNNAQPYRNKLENRYSQFLSTELDQMRKETNEFDESGVHDKDKLKRKISVNSSQVKNEFDENQNSNSYLNNKSRMNTNPDLQKNEMKYEKSSSDYNITNRNKTNSTIIQPTWNASNQSRSPATEKSKMTIETRQKVSSQSNLHLQKIQNNRKKQQEHQQNFLNLLRKAKNRGEVLCEKLMKHPADKQPKNQ